MGDLKKILKFFKSGRQKSADNASQKPKIQAFALEKLRTPSGLFDGLEELSPLESQFDLNGDLEGVENLLEIASVDPDGDVFPDEAIPLASTIEPESVFEEGVFTVGNSGQIEVEFLYDGGGYKGELALFSLDGLEELDFEDPEDYQSFLLEASTRTLSDSPNGRILISDPSEGPRFRNNGTPARNYLGIKTFEMEPGERYGLMLVPNGTVQQLYDRLAAGEELPGKLQPLFSLSTANPADGFHFGQIADVTGDGNTFALEDLRMDGRSDRDYNDIIFQIRGATGEAVHLDEVIDSENDWRETDIGQEVLSYVDADSDSPEIAVSLSNDTGSSNSDTLTNDPTIAGVVSDESSIANFQVKFSSQSNYTTLTTQLDADGSFTLEPAELETLFGGQVPGGTHTLQFQATDEHGNISEVFDYTFTLDTTTSVNFGLDSNFDSVPVGDNQTELEIVTLTGQTEAGNSVVLVETGATTTADAQGNFSFSNVNLNLGDNSFTVEVTDAAGNTSSATQTITRLDIESDPPTITANLSEDTGISNSDALTNNPTIAGVVSDESSIANFQVKFSGQSNYTQITTQLDAEGNFTLEPAELEAIFGSQVPEGTHTLQFLASDERGNISNVFDYTFTLDTTTSVNFGLDSNFDSVPVGDNQTELEIVTLSGQTEAGNTVILVET
ncbi:MAG: Ig-like domain-containing protein, partial [Cyanobacteriota bacterium]|nr:Ig-like domain-containing protein [Cyanobacteriota bacterium]